MVGIKYVLWFSMFLCSFVLYAPSKGAKKERAESAKRRTENVQQRSYSDQWVHARPVGPTTITIKASDSLPEIARNLQQALDLHPREVNSFGVLLGYCYSMRQQDRDVVFEVLRNSPEGQFEIRMKQ